MNLEFKKSTRSESSACVEVAMDHEWDMVYVRDSKLTEDTVLVFNKTEWEAFIGGVKDGEFDL